MTFRTLDAEQIAKLPAVKLAKGDSERLFRNDMGWLLAALRATKRLPKIPPADPEPGRTAKNPHPPAERPNCGA